MEKGCRRGLAKGKAFVYIDVLKRDSTLYRIDDSQVGEEKARIDKAIDDVRQSLTIDAKQIESQLGRGSAAVFLAQKTMLLDPSVVDELKSTLEAERINAEQIVKTVFGLLAGRFRELSDEVLRERGDDIDDLSRRLLLALAEFTRTAWKACLRTPCWSRVNCSHRIRCSFRGQPPSL